MLILLEFFKFIIAFTFVKNITSESLISISPLEALIIYSLPLASLET